MNKFIDPLSDYGFKKLFGNPLILKSFLNDLLEVDIEELTYGNLEIQGVTETDRKVIYDIYCVDKSKRRFIVEMQKAYQPNFKDRILFYSSVAIADQAKKSAWNWQIDTVYIVAILGTFKVSDSQKYLHRIHLKNEENQIFNDKLNQIFIEIKNFNKKDHELESHLDKWLYVLKNLEDLDEIPETLQHDEQLQPVFEIANLSKFGRNELSQYEEAVNLQRIRDSELAGAELKKAISIAKNLIQLGIDVNIVIQSTGLSLEQLKDAKLI